MAAQSKSVAVSGHEVAIALRSIKRLDSMKNGARDERPKTLAALQNVLSKETNLVFVNSVISMLYEYDKPVVFSYVDDILKEDKELDTEIAGIALKKCAEMNRTLHVLPCDSNIHTQMRSQIQSWYETRHSSFDMENPVRGIAAACLLEHELYADQIYTELLTNGYLKEDGNSVDMLLPADGCLRALEKGLKKWEERIMQELGALTVRYYQCFAEIVVGVNADIQGLTAAEMGKYCEAEFAQRYPLFKVTLDHKSVSTMIDKLSVEDMDVTQADGENAGKGQASNKEEMEVADELPVDTAAMFPLNLLPEVAQALVQIAKLDKLSVTKQDVISQIQSVCKIMYIVSPKYVLSSVAEEEKTAKVTGDFVVKLRLGGSVTRKAINVGEITQLAMLLSFPGKNRIFKKYKSRIERNLMFSRNRPQLPAEPVKVPMEDIRETLKAFQLHIHCRSKDISQRKRSTVVMNDPVSESRCKQTLFTWLDSFNDNQSLVLTEEIFSKKVLELSFEDTYWPSHTIIQKLADKGYLEIKGEKIAYKPYYRSHEFYDGRTEIMKFLGRWTTDQKPRDSSKPTEGQLSMDCSMSRKRCNSDSNGSDGVKKAKILDL